MARVRVRRGGANDRVVDLPETAVNIGRAPENEICLPEPEVSTVHARLESAGADVWLIRDLGSLNGTVVDGKRLRPGDTPRLEAGSVIGIGPFELEFNSEHRSETIPSAVRAVDLTPTERETLELLFMHYDDADAGVRRVATLKEIAERRFVGTDAVKQQLKNLYTKFELEGGDRNKEMLAQRAQEWRVTTLRF